MPYMVANSYMGLAVESQYGVAASVSTFTPVASPKLTPNLKFLDDSDFRGSPGMHYDQVPGTRYDGYSFKSYIFSDVFPEIVRAALGSVDTVASVGPSLWTHTIGLQNSPNTGSQPPSYTIINDSVDNTYSLTASRLSDLSISFASDAAVEATASFVCNQFTTTASVTANESVQHLVPAWNCSASINGASVAVVESGSIDIKRSTTSIFTLGNSGPYNNFAGPIDVTGKLVFIVEAGQPWYADALTRAQIPVVLRFVDPVTGFAQQFTMSACQLTSPQIDQSKTWVELDTSFTACMNTTDVQTFGYAPIKFQATNNISAAY